MFEDQEVELLPARTVMSTVARRRGGGSNNSSGACEGYGGTPSSGSR